LAEEWRQDFERRLSVHGVLRLPYALDTTEQMMPSDAQVWAWAGAGISPCRLPHEWRQILKRRGQRLVMLLRMAAELEEEVAYGN
jgi:hypothetical protein